jgi:hypothetical protein
MQVCVPQPHELDGHMNSNENTVYAKSCPCSLGNAHILFHVDKPHTLCKMQLSFKCSEILNFQVKFCMNKMGKELAVPVSPWQVLYRCIWKIRGRPQALLQLSGKLFISFSWCILTFKSNILKKINSLHWGSEF